MRASEFCRKRAQRQVKRTNGQVAQLVEQRTENPCVGGSIPPLATKNSKGLQDINRQAFLLKITCFKALM
jgi:hypothetical protein